MNKFFFSKISAFDWHSHKKKTQLWILYREFGDILLNIIQITRSRVSNNWNPHLQISRLPLPLPLLATSNPLNFVFVPFYNILSSLDL